MRINQMNAKADITDKIVMPTDCSKGKHTFIPAVWKIQPNTHSCTLFVCQNCLMSADKTEVEVMSKKHHEDIEKKKNKPTKDTKA